MSQRFENRRETLINFVESFYSMWGRTAIFREQGRPAFIVEFDDLTEAALERCAARLCADFWFVKKLNRENRARREAIADLQKRLDDDAWPQADSRFGVGA